MRWTPALLLIVAVAGCGGDASTAPPAATGAALRSGIDRSTMDPAVRPQDNLYRAVNGRWLDATAIPDDRSRWGSFIELADRAEHDLKSIVDELGTRGGAEPGTPARQIADLYRSYMDTDRITAAGLAPLAGTLASIDAIDSPAALAGWIGTAQARNVAVPLGLFIDQDSKDTHRYLVHLSQWGLGLPDRDYYLVDDERMAAIRSEYAAYVDRLFALASLGDGAGATVLRVETALARAQWTRVQNRDRDATYNLVDHAAAATLAPDIDWALLFEAMGLPATGQFIVLQPDYVIALGGLFKSVPIEDWKAYLRFQVLDAVAPYLDAPYVEAHFHMHREVLSGIPEQQPRWQRGINLLNTTVGELLGQLYVERHFQPTAKARMDELVANLLAAFAAGIDQLDWMTEPTRVEAHRKLAKFTTKIGYPERWKDYSGLVVDPADLLGNLERATALEYRRQLAKLDQPIDRTEWFMTPQTVNAYYNPSMNEIVFPAAILQPPFFDAAADDAVNYGAIGAVIGHEISHGFDDQGRKSDGDGNLRDWWTDEDARRFEARARQVVELYGTYEPVPGMKVNGELTLGENIGDISGLAVAWQAWQRSLDGRESPVIDGLTGAQRFFMGYAQVWRMKQREEATRQQLITDPHSPAEVRADATARNQDAFHEAFATQPGDGMYLAPADRIRIW